MSTERTITAFFNPQREGDTFKGLNSTVKGTVAPTIIRNLREFLKAAGRDYFIRKVPALYSDPFGAMGPDGMVPAVVEVPGQFHLARSSDGRIVSPHTVQGQYGTVCLMDIAEDLEPWVAEGWATPDGVYDRNGSLEILSLRLDAGSVDTTGSEFLHYAILEIPHGTGGKVKGKIISWRIVCGNTFARAVGAVSDFTISHRVANGDPDVQTAIMKDRSKLAIETWESLKTHVRELANRTETLRSMPLTLADAGSLTDKLLDIAGKSPENISGDAKNKREAILQAFNMPQFGTFGANAYDWLNAVTFENSSPFSDRVKKSKVSPIDRLVRNVTANGTGLKVEEKANSLIEALA